MSDKPPTRALAIPTIGEVLQLAEDWTFPLWAEYRNSAMMAYLEASGAIPPDSPHVEPLPTLCGAACVTHVPARPAGHFAWQGPVDAHDVHWTCQALPGHDGDHVRHVHYPRETCRYSCTVPAGTKLRVDRIYIRKGASDFDSLTFFAIGLPNAKGKRPRFWAKLADVNRMVVTVDPNADLVTTPMPIRAIRIREDA